MRGIRLVIDDFRADVTKTLNSGKRGRLRIAYGDPRKPDTAEPAFKWLWRYVRRCSHRREDAGDERDSDEDPEVG